MDGSDRIGSDMSRCGAFVVVYEGCPAQHSPYRTDFVSLDLSIDERII